MNLIKTLPYYLLILISFASCFAPPVSSPVLETYNAAEKYALTNVHYGNDPKQVMDIYLPANRSVQNTKMLLLIHGGGWMMGDKAEFTGGIAQVQASLPDYAVFNINYRLYANGNNKHPAQEDDIKAAYQFILNMRSKAQLSDKIVIAGTSAGAHLAMLQAYKNSAALKPKAVVNLYGPTDLARLFNENASAAKTFTPIVGATPQQDPELFRQISPISFVDKNSPPTIILHGAKDNLVYVSQATALKKKLDAYSVPNEIIIYPNSGHGLATPEASGSMQSINAFIKKHVK